jgi:hypothetical protein
MTVGKSPQRLLLVLAREQPEAWVSRELEQITGGSENAEVRVVAPTAPASRLDLLTGDVDDSIAEAENRAAATAAETDGESAAEVGDADPLLAIEDALATFEADQIVIAAPRPGDESWFDEDLPEQARERFDLPVQAIVPPS